METYTNDPNVCGRTYGPATTAQIAGVIERHGWSVRKCSWTDWEIENEWSRDLIIEDMRPVGTLPNGPFTKCSIRGFHFSPGESAPKLIAVLRELGQESDFEIYDEHERIIQTITSADCPRPTDA